MTELFSNLGQTSINQIGGIGATDTTVVVASLNGTNPANAFPSSGNFRLVFGNDLNSEITLCTAVNSATNTFTIVRGQEGTTAQAWVNGTTVALILTAQSINQMRADAFSVGTYSTRPLQGLPTGSYYQTTDGHTPWIWDSNIGAWRPQINGILGFQPPPATLFSIGVNQGVATIVDSGKGALDFTNVADGANTVNFHGYFFNFAGPCFVEACLAIQINASFAVGNSWTSLGPALRESATGKLVFFGQSLTLSSGVPYIEADIYSAPTTRTASSSVNFDPTGVAPVFLRIIRDNKNVTFQYSRDRVLWTTSRQDLLTTDFTSTTDQIGIGGFSAGFAGFHHILSFNYGSLYSPITNIMPPPPPPPAPPVFRPVGYVNSILNH